MLTLGSFFDGIGGWLVAARHAGSIKPLWSSEIAPFPETVSRHHFPDVEALGDITKLDGTKLPPVDIICAGSPCQDLSVAGKREGLKGARSGLFITSIKLVREMRAATGGKYPRYFVWENVPGAFSSNGGNDFRAVLEEIAEAPIPMPGSGKWADSGLVRSGLCEIAWRVLDSQYWGVPQRRRRIFLVADFAAVGRCAGKILFEQEGMPGNPAESREQEQDSSRTACCGTEKTGRTGVTVLNDQGGKVFSVSIDKTATLRAEEHGHQPLIVDAPCRNAAKEANVVYSFDSAASNSMKSKNPHSGCHVTTIAKTLDTTYPDPSKNQGGIAVYEAPSADSSEDTPESHEHSDVHTYTIQGSMIGRSLTAGPQGDGINEDLCFTLNTTDRHAVCCTDAGCFSNVASTLRAGAGAPKHMSDICGRLVMSYSSEDQESNTEICEENGSQIVGSLCADDHKGINNQYVSANKVQVQHGRVRRLTPVECERLQGLPDNYTDIPTNGKPASDSARYKAIGNGMAQPCPDFVLRNIAHATDVQP